jgi:murein DD-endopeptidase MepM/ murein hydrolase activator NlpD
MATAGGGGVAPPDPPQVSDVVCISTCAGVRKATTDSQVQVSGRHLGNVNRVLFNSTAGGRIGVDPSSVSRHTVTAPVPAGAATGRPKVEDPYDNAATSPTTLRIVSANQVQSSGTFDLKNASATPTKAYYYGKRRPGVTYMFTNSEPTDVRIDVVRARDDTVVDSFIQQAQEPNTTHTATWNGLEQGSRKPAPNGHYEFRVGPVSGGMGSTGDSRFSYHRFIFPVRGPHTYGDGVGAPRAGHIHQGQDVGAACGTKLKAARGGTVQYKAYQASGAGNYLVIDGKRTSHDYVYMHLRSPSPLNKGQRVRTGQKVGVVGETGDATGCHLHFEEWSGPGWYEGGHFLRSVTKHLRQWDSWS